MTPASSAPTTATSLDNRPKIGLSSAIIFVISSVVGTGVFKKVVPMAAELGSPTLVLLAWLLAGLVSLAGTLSNAEVASMLASEGGEYVYFRIIYNRFFAFLFGWTNFAVIRTASIASIAYVFAQSVNSLIPLPATPAAWADFSLLGLHPLENSSVKLLAIALVWGQTAFNIRGLRTGEAISRALTAIMVIVMVGFVIMGLVSGVGSVANLQPIDTGLSGSSLLSAMALACLSAFWPYEGWNTVGYIGGEIKNPSRNLPWALTIGTLAIMVLYLLMNLVYLYVVPVGDLAALKGQPNSIAAVTVAGTMAGSIGSLVLSCLLLVTTFNCCSITILMASRLFYAMSKDGQFFSRIDYLHPTFQTPSRSLLLQAAWTTLMVLSGSFDTLTDMLIFAAFIFYGATTVGVFILRKRMPDTERPYRVIGYPIVPGLFIAFCAYLVINTLINRPYEAGVGLLLMATGVPFYFYWKRKQPA
ncbi:basic amino acid/polyamine antiporter, APA family [Fibrella aestuarina BUZ 2]|uniref:Basic amino acid/polyamine antiporter, APA family n=1 Tax=Fibrella aestuarina BUZ 2 TaxID=1166018 RepID=I0KEP9_9BACT|nr:amino acid permease [Fibrella aestuarina]CCH02602.1 basic amino acid/polyamine antiporter, APA family [Fibrella aestuarina BUZ 2]